MMKGLIRIILALLLGVTTTVLVAWGFTRVDRNALRYEEAFIDRGRGGWHVLLFDNRVGVTMIHTRLTGWDQAGSDVLDSSSVPCWSVAHDPTPHRLGPDVIDANWICEQAFGWPFRALKYESRYAGFATQFPQGISGGIELGDDHVLSNWWITPYMSGSEYVLPTMVLWRGFAADATIYAIGCYAVFFAAGDLRRRWRQRRGRCVCCGYDLRGAAHQRCPECGTGVRAEAVQGEHD